MITAAGAPGHRWIDPPETLHFKELDVSGLATLHKRNEDGKSAISVVFTQKGAELMKSIGFTEADIEKANARARD
jgi:hypothetical protein